jgi:tetratricopeptide (TPR) repeat protein
MEPRSKKVLAENEKNFIKTIENSLKLIKKDEVNEAYINLNILERELEKLADQGTVLEAELVITALHNIAYCHQKTGELEESASYVEACIFNAENKYKQGKSKTKSDAYYSNRIKQASYLSSMYSYLCVLMSCIENHYIAVLHAQKALDYARVAIKHTIKAANKGITHSISAQKLRKKIYLGEISRKTTKEKPPSNLSILMMSLKMLNSKDIPSGLIKLNTIEGVKQELKDNMNLNSAMKINTLTYYKLKTLTNLDFELEGDEVFKKIYNVVIALYLISSEKAMMDDKQNAINIRNKSVAIARTFLPNDSSILSQIKYLDE